MKVIPIGGSEAVEVKGLNPKYTMGYVVVLTAEEYSKAQLFNLELCGEWPSYGGCILLKGHAGSGSYINFPSLHSFLPREKAMSSSLYYRPAPTPPVETQLPSQLKRAMAPRYWQHDGTLNGQTLRLSQKDIDYLEGLNDAGVEGAEELINAIQENQFVDVWISN